ncbi:IclR family transcriptional regulator [Streptomyces sp. NPDC058247]|uniref:IclR family transcriptional regulator n=1 Tax=Streptomyces sp. NPDC058247 TaxID=3346401 RepID=UPI0036E43768
MQDSSVTRALRILDLIAHAGKPLTLKHIAEVLDIPRSTAHGILRDLTRERFVETGEPAAYTIGIKAFEVGAAHLRVAGVGGVIAVELVRLTDALDITAHYAVLDGTEAVYLYKQDPPGLGVQLASSVGARLPAHLTAVGKCCLAWLHPRDLAAHVAPAVREGPDGDAVLAALTDELAKVRERGYATDHGQVAGGVECLAAPVFDTSGVKGAVGISYLRGAEARAGEATEQVRQTAARLTSMFGGNNQ